MECMKLINYRKMKQQKQILKAALQECMKKKANSQKKSCSDITWKRLNLALKDIKG